MRGISDGAIIHGALDQMIPRSSLIVGFLISFGMTVGIRFSYRLLRALRNYLNHRVESKKQQNIMIIGDGRTNSSLELLPKLGEKIYSGIWASSAEREDVVRYLKAMGVME